MTTVQRLIEFASADHQLPASVRADTVRLLADTLAVGAAGSASREAAPVTDVIRGWGTANQSRTLAGRWVPGPSAAFLNGFAIHCLEWDAVHEPAVVHALSVVTATLLAVSDSQGGSNPDEFLTALAIGVEIASGMGLSATGAMRFFRPATAGILGATLAGARLAGLDGDAMADALGLAYSFTSGTMQSHVEASTALPLQIANAARGAVTAIDMAQAGIDGPHDMIDGLFGYSQLIEPVDTKEWIAGLGQSWRISEVSIKPYPSGRASHGALGALADLRDEDAFAIDDVAGIELFAPPLIHRLVGRPFQPNAPQSYNRLCLAFLAPLMLRDGLIDPRIDRTVETLAKRVQVKLDGNPDLNALSPQHLIVRLHDGQSLERAVAANPGSPQAPLSAARAQTKYELCRSLAGMGDARIFETPLQYATEPK